VREVQEAVGLVDEDEPDGKQTDLQPVQQPEDQRARVHRRLRCMRFPGMLEVAAR
jgi:hypothetical protein